MQQTFCIYCDIIQKNRKFKNYRTFVLTNECSPAIMNTSEQMFLAKGGFTMAFTNIILSFFEMAAIILLIVGFINEKKIAAFEAKLARAIRIHLRNRRRRKQRELAMAQAKIQMRAPADVYEETPVISITNGKIINFNVA